MAVGAERVKTHFRLLAFGFNLKQSSSHSFLRDTHMLKKRFEMCKYQKPIQSTQRKSMNIMQRNYGMISLKVQSPNQTQSRGNANLALEKYMKLMIITM